MSDSQAPAVAAAPTGKAGDLRRDALAGFNTAVNGVPDGMATALLVGINPVYGLYAGMVGPLVGGLFSSSRLMVVTTTSAAGLAAGQALAGVAEESRVEALFLMAILIGLIQIVAGVLRGGWLMRFVSHSVMTGLLLGIAILIVLSQLPDAAGYKAQGASTMAKTLHLFANLGAVSLASLGVAAATLVLALVLPLTRLGPFGLLLAVAIPSAAAALLQLDAVEVVRNIGEMPRGLPTPFVPSLSHAGEVLGGAFAVALIVLVQGAGVSHSVPNPNGTVSNVSRDFVAQGAANVACGLLRGIPVGASLSSTALSVVSGAASRAAAIFAGLWMAAIVLLIPGLVGYVALPALAVLLIVAAVQAIKPAQIASIWHTGWLPRLAAMTTFIATLLFPIEIAVAIGVTISGVIYLAHATSNVFVVELAAGRRGRIRERRTPRRLRPGQATVLEVYGELFFAGARTLQRLLPDPSSAHHAIVILRLRDRSEVGATLVDVLAEYVEKLQAVDGRLYLTGVSWEMREQLERSGKLPLSGPVRIYEATPVRGQATRTAYADAQAWLVGLRKEEAA